MRVMVDPLDFDADLSPTAENSVFYFSCMRAADLYLYFWSIRQHWMQILQRGDQPWYRSSQGVYGVQGR
eukprot:COSAG05_NODE_17025_length_333_cov_0.888889_1_plen_68_part_10